MPVLTKVAAQIEAKSAGNNSSSNLTSQRAGKLSYKLQLELESLPATIESLEQQVEEFQQTVNDPDFSSRIPLNPI